MKNILQIIFIFFLIPISVNAYSTDILDKIENDFYGFNYSNDKTINRIERLEKSVYGKTSSGDINKRITKLSGDVSSDVIGLQIEPVRDTFLADDYEQEDSNVNYPIVNDIEQKLFNTTYKNRDLHTRIVTIEKKLFGKIYDIDDYSTRMDRIKSHIYPQSVAFDDEIDNYNNYNDNYLTSKDLSGTNQSRFRMPFGQRNYTRPYTNYGDNNKDYYNSDNLSDELSQLEYDTFGTEFSSDDTQTRIKRLNSASKAKKTSQKYDSQKFSQRMSTAMEIGAMILMILAMVLWLSAACISFNNIGNIRNIAILSHKWCYCKI